MTSRFKKSTPIFFLLVIAFTLIVILKLFYSQYTDSKEVKIDFGSGILARNVKYLDKIDKIQLIGVKRNKLHLPYFSTSNEISGSLIIGSKTFKINDCNLVGNLETAHYIGTINDESGNILYSFVADKNLTFISIINFKDDQRLIAPAKSLKDFIEIDSLTAIFFSSYMSKGKNFSCSLIFI